MQLNPGDEEDERTLWERAGGQGVDVSKNIVETAAPQHNRVPLINL
jgi:hypothetical protein